MSLTLDAREILAYLNEMGYRNITADQLKEFMKDLKRLIKYEDKYFKIENLQQILSSNYGRQPQPINSNLLDVFDKLHLTSTVASRAKSASAKKQQTIQLNYKENNEPMSSSRRPSERENRQKICNKNELDSSIQGRKEDKDRKFHSQCTKKHNKDNQEKQFALHSVPSQSSLTDNTNSHFIRNTPTDLYQYYQNSWMKFKHCVPGENSRSSVRIPIRKRMEHIQRTQSKPKVYLSINPSDHHKTIKRVV